MSRILRRPMFRGGRVDSRGTGITSGLDKPKRGLVDEPGGYAGEEFLIGQGMFDELQNTGGSRSYTQYKKPIGPPRGGLSGGNIYTRALAKARNLPIVGRFAVPLLGSTTSALGAGAGVGVGLGSLLDFYAQSTKTPEEYRRLKEMSEFGIMDETNLDVGEALDYIKEGGEIGEAPGFFPRGGKKKYFEEKGLNPETGLPIPDTDKRGDPEANLDLITKESKTPTVVTGEEVDTDTTVGQTDLQDMIERYEELLGGGKARQRDVGDILGRASAAFLGAGDVREGLAEFMKAESQAGPSRTERIKQAAAMLGIKGEQAKKLYETKLAGQTGQTQKAVEYISRITGKDPQSALKDYLRKESTFAETAGKYKAKEGVLSPQGFALAAEEFFEDSYIGDIPTDGNVNIGDKATKKSDGIYTDKENKIIFEIKDQVIISSRKY